VAVDGELTFREGLPSDLRATFELEKRAWDASRRARGLTPSDIRGDHDVEAQWVNERPLTEFIAAQEDGRYWVCEQAGRLIAYARVARFGSMDELTEMWVDPDHAGRGVGRELMTRCWPEPPTPDLGRVVLSVGTPVDLTLYTHFGVMPAAGHWHMRIRVSDYLERRSHELVDAPATEVVALKAERAVEEWKRLEPSAIGHERPLLHEFFGRTRSCLAIMDREQERALAVCWVSPNAEIGPAVGEGTEHLVPVVLAALDRVAKMQEPESLGVFCTTSSWWLLDRLRRLGFRVYWPSWVMCSVPLPGLDRYLGTFPPRLL
jgi:GNAT superfamily N-acetyltransferase